MTYNFQNVSIKCDLLSQALHLASIAREQGEKVDDDKEVEFTFKFGTHYFQHTSSKVFGFWSKPFAGYGYLRYSDFITTPPAPHWYDYAQSAEH